MDPAQRIRDMLHDLMVASTKAFDEIHDIAQHERQRVGEQSEEGQAWYAFAGLGLFSDSGRADAAIRDAIAAVRGMLTYRGLDGGDKDQHGPKDGTDS